ncbi:MalY/PatB family protein [Homoserinibacter sp. YIM 151385]|uniref:MalY/PatB family protein n=1 Tax=Homoserinibacter sp. YIM 151385 TaxID=2985506 RepID=UPI0022F05998|nr:aminotransferase class I/II-fold pyridoxal phosphate-dependent enzyme [Homoserinibacter sp. YIM 151385]WBU39202.1 aminotransferase class I/II-fold pyridoxal phosphate-dependent enzyme [Homoserinibacter sp. YIM 151385]
MSSPVVAEPLETLRRRTSEKWRAYPDDVLPLFVAEMDYPLAPPVKRAMLDLIERSDTGYVSDMAPLASAFAGFAERRYGWTVDPAMVRSTTDVSVAIVELLRGLTEPGDGVVIMPPVYTPFPWLVEEAGARVVEVPLRRPDAAAAVDGVVPAAAWSIDLDGVEAALAAGARGVLLCSPHNPLGLVHPRAVLERLAEIARAHGAFVVSDEIHAPLTHHGVEFTPFLAVSDAAREVGLATPSASKAFNLAGVKCALMVAGSARGAAVLDALPIEVTWRASLLGRAASTAGFAEGGEWLDGVREAIAASRDRLVALIAEHLPGAVLHSPDASYLGWLDLRGAGFEDDPAERILAEGRVALNRGLDFSTAGREGEGFVRVNLACSAEVLEEAVRRIAGMSRPASLP